MGSSTFSLCLHYLQSLLFSPHLCGNLLHKVNLCPLFSFGQFVANLTGSEATLWTEAEVLKRYVSCCISYSGFYFVRIFKLRTLGCDESEHYYLAFRDILQRLEAARTGIVILQIESINILFCEDKRCNGIISSFCCVGGMIVSTTGMSGKCNI